MVARNPDWDITEFVTYAQQRRKELGISNEALAERIAYLLNPGRTPVDPDWYPYRSKQVQRVFANNVGREHMTPRRTAAWITASEMDDAKVREMLPKDHYAAVKAIQGERFRAVAS